MRGAEPTVDEWPRGSAFFGLFRTNLAALLKDSGKEVVVPSSLSEAEEIPAGSGLYTKEEVTDLAKKYRKGSTSSNHEARIFILFVDGFLSGGGKKMNDIVGLNVDPDGVVAVFKGAIDQRTKNRPDLRSSLEQVVMIHEAGHAIGLVANGIPTVSAHLDADHPGHCTNPKCIMHFKMEGGAALMDLLDNAVMGSRTILFGQECLDDVRARLSTPA
ncbi:MAG: hypothetical protein V1495_08230 [Pseudomonadota bacterium]